MGLSDSLRGLASAGAGAGTVIKPAVGATAISGLAAPYAAVPVYKGSSTTPIGTAFADAAGNWSLTLGTPAALSDVYRTPSSGAIVGVVLNALTVSTSAATIGVAFMATIGGLTSGSTVSLTGAGAAGLSVSGATISGTPTTAGAVNIVETNANGTNSPRTTSALITVAAAPVGPTPLSITGANGTMAVGDTGSFTPTISGGTAPYTVSATNLPPGRTITNTATGLTTGAYTTAGTYNATYTVTDSLGATASFTRTVTVNAAVSNITGIVANRGAISSRNTLAPTAGAVQGQALSQHTVTHPFRYAVVWYENVYSNSASLVSTGLPTLTLSTGSRVRVQSGLNDTLLIRPSYVPDTDGVTPTTSRDLVLASGEMKPVLVDYGKVLPVGCSILDQRWARYASLPTGFFYPETDTQAVGFQESAQWAATIADITLGDTQWSSVTKFSGYGILVPRLIQGLQLSSKPKSFILCGTSIGSAGSGDSASTTTGQGFCGGWQKALGNNFGWSNVGCTGLSLVNVLTTPNRLLSSVTRMLDKGFTHALMEWGANDIASNRSVNAYMADLATIDGMFTNAGMKMVVCTILPRPAGVSGNANYNGSQTTNALDSGYASANGGKPAWQAVNEINALIRSTYSGRVADTHAVVADPADPTRWRTDLATQPSGDLIHPNAFFHNQIRDALIPVLQAA